MPSGISDVLQHTMWSLVTPLEQQKLLISSYLHAVYRSLVTLWILSAIIVSLFKQLRSPQRYYL